MSVREKIFKDINSCEVVFLMMMRKIWWLLLVMSLAMLKEIYF